MPHVRVQRTGDGKFLLVDGSCASIWRPGQAFTGGSWDLLAAPVLLAPADRAPRVLLLGVGGGTVIRVVRALRPEADIVAIDLDAEVLAVARRAVRARLARRPHRLRRRAALHRRARRPSAVRRDHRRHLRARRRRHAQTGRLAYDAARRRRLPEPRRRARLQRARRRRRDHARRRAAQAGDRAGARRLPQPHPRSGPPPHPDGARGRPDPARLPRAGARRCAATSIRRSPEPAGAKASPRPSGQAVPAILRVLASVVPFARCARCTTPEGCVRRVSPSRRRSADRRLRRRHQTSRRTDADPRHGAHRRALAAHRGARALRRASTRCGSRSSATCTCTPASPPTPTIFGTKIGPRDAYDFARGGTIVVLRRRRAADAAACTSTGRSTSPPSPTTPSSSARCDVCTHAGLAGLRHPTCARSSRQADAAGRNSSAPPCSGCSPPASTIRRRRCPSATMPGVDCDAAAVSVWQEIQAAAEEAYDRSGACTLHQLHRLRAHAQPAAAATCTATSSSATSTCRRSPPASSRRRPAASRRGCGRRSRTDCLNAGTGCDAVIIPHNSNLSGGLQFFDPADATEAQRRQDREPLVEIHQIKGNSECRFDRLAGRGVGTEDELCAFEQLSGRDRGAGQRAAADRRVPARATWCATRSRTGLRSRRRSASTRSASASSAAPTRTTPPPATPTERSWEGAQRQQRRDARARRSAASI